MRSTALLIGVLLFLPSCVSDTRKTTELHTPTVRAIGGMPRFPSVDSLYVVADSTNGVLCYVRFGIGGGVSCVQPR